MHFFYYNPEVIFLLMDEQGERVPVIYDEKRKPFKLPLVGPRPPYYTNPTYEKYYPII